MADNHDMAASIDQMHRLFADTLLPGLHEERAAVEDLLAHSRNSRDAIRTHLDEAFEQLDSPMQAAEQALTAIEEHTTRLGSALSSILSEAKSRVDALATGFNEQIEASAANFQALAEVVVSGDRESTQSLEQMRALLEDIKREASEQMLQLESGTVETESRLSDAASSIAERLGALETALGKLEHECAEGFASLGEAVDERSRDVGSDLRSMLQAAGEAITTLRQSSEQVFGDLQQTGEALEHVFGSSAEDLLKDVQQLLAIVEQIRPLLEIIEEWA